MPSSNFRTPCWATPYLSQRSNETLTLTEELLNSGLPSIVLGRTVWFGLGSPPQEAVTESLEAAN